VEGVAGLFPGVEATAKWADAIYAELVQLQGELGVVSSLGQVQSRMKSRSRGMMSLWSLSSLGPSTVSNTFDSTGIVLFRSATPCIRLARRKSSFFPTKSSIGLPGLSESGLRAMSIVTRTSP